MRIIRPYKTTTGAISSLDNGGRFFNILTDAKDGKIEASELAKAAGVFTNSQKMVLYLEMSLGNLPKADTDSIIRSLSSDLKSKYRKYKPQHYTPSQAKLRGKAGQSAIVRGVPHFMKSNADFTGFIMVPISNGNTTSFAMIPIIDYYDVYEVYDDITEQDFLVAHARGVKKLSRISTVFGGILKKLNADKNKKQKHNLFLETIYYYVA